MDEKSRCGPHTELAKSEGARITRCACGTIHVHVSRSGVTVQFSADAFSDLAKVVADARENVRAFEIGSSPLRDSSVH